jgi:hypothetical protein
MPDPTYSGVPYMPGPERHDELSSGVSAGSEQAEASQERRHGGARIAPGSKLVPAMGGKARKGRTKLTHDVAPLPVSDVLKRRARFARRKTAGELAAVVGGGRCGILASLFVKLGVEDIALREAALERGDIQLAKALGESARMHLLYARETCAKDAKVAGTGSALPAGTVWDDDKTEAKP